MKQFCCLSIIVSKSSFGGGDNLGKVPTRLRTLFNDKIWQALEYILEKIQEWRFVSQNHSLFCEKRKLSLIIVWNYLECLNKLGIVSNVWIRLNWVIDLWEWYMDYDGWHKSYLFLRYNQEDFMWIGNGIFNYVIWIITNYVNGKSLNILPNDLQN